MKRFSDVPSLVLLQWRKVLPSIGHVQCRYGRVVGQSFWWQVQHDSIDLLTIYRMYVAYVRL